MSRFRYLGLIVIIFCLGINNNSQAQSENIEALTYISPVPGSKFIMPGNNIALRHGEAFDINSISSSLLGVFREDGKRIEGSIKLSADQKTLIYKPYDPFPMGETIRVELTKGLKTVRGLLIQPVVFEFSIANKVIQLPEMSVLNYSNIQDSNLISKAQSGNEKKINLKNNNLPQGFPDIDVSIQNDQSHDEFYFFSPWAYGGNVKPFLIITDHYGTPVYYLKGYSALRDFKLQHKGYLSYATMDPQWKLMVMDSAYHLIDYFQIGNGYINTDFHDFQLLENGHAFVIGVDWQPYAMDTVVPGGDPNALVCGFIIQEQDTDKNVIFQWRSWDHFSITDAGPQIDLTSNLIDYVHGNAVEVESDTSIIISSRSLDEITKIHRNSGEIIWRFGGKKNQFNIQNDTLGFTMQHDCRRLSNGHITLFDNGTMHPEPTFSSALEYELDENNFEAVLIRRLRSDPDIFGGAMGSAQWKDDQSVVVGWGNGDPGVTEFSQDGEIDLVIDFQGISYRAFRFPWKTNYFFTDTDSLQFEIGIQDSLLKEIEIYNNNEFKIEITSIFINNPGFSVINEFPLLIPASGSAALIVKFKPDTLGIFKDVLTVNSDINTDTLVQRIAQQVHLVGFATEGQGLGARSKLQVGASPNPVKNHLKLSFSGVMEKVNISIFNHAGQKVLEVFPSDVSLYWVDMSSFRNGLYFIEIRNDKQDLLNCLKIVKE